MATWSWIIPSVVAVLFFYLARRASKERIYLSAYAAHLLLNREVAEDHARKLREFIGNSRATGAVQLSLSVSNWVEGFATRGATAKMAISYSGFMPWFGR